MAKKEKKQKEEIAKKSNEEIIKLIKELAEKNTTEKIGQILKDKYGVPKAKLAVGKISKIIKVKEPSDIMALVKKANELRRHLEKNKQDKVAKRGLNITEAKLIKLSRYYKRKKTLPQDWKFK